MRQTWHSLALLGAVLVLATVLYLALSVLTP
jgi:hypothetical protein